MSRADADHVECLALLAKERAVAERRAVANAKLVEEQDQARAEWNAEVRALRDENAELRALVKHLETPAGALLAKVTRERDALLKAVQGVREALGTLGAPQEARDLLDALGRAGLRRRDLSPRRTPEEHAVIVAAERVAKLFDPEDTPRPDERTDDDEG